MNLLKDKLFNPFGSNYRDEVIPMDKVRFNKKLKKGLSFAAFIFPAVFFILLFVEIPFIVNVAYSFTKWNGLDKIPAFIGSQNYREFLTDDTGAVEAIGFTLKYGLLMTLLLNIGSLLLAVLLDNRKVKSRNALRAVFYIPNIISLIVIGYIWRFIFSRAFDVFYSSTRLAPFHWSWLGSPGLAFLSVVLVSLWQGVGFYMVVYLAGLQSVPQDTLEAAVIDGTGKFRQFFSITLPLIMPSLTFCVFLALVNSVKLFDIPLTLTFGGPGTATTSISLDIYKEAFINNRFGYATAKSVVLFLVTIVFTFIQLTAFKKREVEL
jgi:ABC-type sugar transport systems, permease components